MLHSVKTKFFIGVVLSSLIAVAITITVTPFVFQKRLALRDTNLQHVQFIQRSVFQFQQEFGTWGGPELAPSVYHWLREANIPEKDSRYARLSGAGFAYPQVTVPHIPRPTPGPDVSLITRLPLITDHLGYVVYPGLAFNIGEKVPSEWIASATAVYADDAVIAYLFIDESRAASGYHTVSLSVLQESLLVVGLVGVMVALLIGLGYSQRLHDGLLKLLKGPRKNRDIAQPDFAATDSTIHSIDDLGVRFRKMHEELQLAYKRLHESNRTIQQQAKQIQLQSLTDELTQLHSRRYFNEQFSKHYRSAASSGQPLSVVVGDVDLFKRINENYSQKTGDEVLKIIAGIISSQIRTTDIAARYSGEEVVLSLPGTDIEQAGNIVEKIRLDIQQYPWSKVAMDLQVTMSFGVTQTLGSCENDMLRNADEHLLLAKQQGRNRSYPHADHEC